MIRINKNFSGYFLIILVALLGAFFVAESADNNATLSLKRDPGSGLFVLKMSDSQGIKNFSLVYPTDKFPYSGALGGCPKSNTIDNVLMEVPADFTPLMNAAILDCQGNETEFEITISEDGIVQVKKAGIAPPPPPPPPPPVSESAPSTGSGQAPSGSIIPDVTSAEVAKDPLANIQYPVNELGDCGDKEACKTYCEKEANLDRCLVYAEEHGLLKQSELERGKKFSVIVKTGGGPGGCTTERECFSYCNDVDRIDECVAFAEKNGFMEGEELAEAKKIQAIVKSGKSMPGNCKNRTACEAYCKNTEHMDECIAFAKEAGFMSAEEIAEIEKFLPLIKSGQTPGGCKSKEECESFCEVEDNFEACFDFADKAGLITEKEKEMMKKTGGKGPGGCRGRACQTFCENPANQKACFEFGKEHGMISDADLARMEEGKQMIKKQLETGPPEIQECLRSVVDITVLESEGFAGGPELGEKMRECFELLIPQGMQDQFEFGEGGEFHGPGGCMSHEECEAYCQSNPEACGFGGAGGPGGGGGPANCGSPEECQAYCNEHPDECGGGGGGFGGGPGGCQAQEECFAYCTEHITDPDCAAYTGGGGGGGGNTGGGGPGGCQSPAECQTYCQANYTDPACAGYGGGGGLPPSPPAQSCAPVPSGLVSWLDDDKTSATETGVLLAPGKVGNALKFDATGGYVKEENPNLNLNFGTGPFSLEAWFNWDGGGSSKGNLIRKANYPVSGDGAGYWLVIGKDNSTLEFFAGETVGNPGKPRGSVSSPISSGVWYHVAATRNGSGTLSLYIDGQLKGTAEAAGADTTSPAPFTLGAWDDRFGVTELFSGLIDEASVYNRALTASEVQAIFNAGSNGKCSGTSNGTTQPPPSGDYQQQYQQQQFQGPGGCTNTQECTDYCTKNYQDPACQQFMPSGTQPSSQAPRPVGIGSMLGAILAPLLQLFGF